MIENTLFLTQNTLFGNQMTQNTLFYGFFVDARLGEHDSRSAQDWRTLSHLWRSAKSAGFETLVLEFKSKTFNTRPLRPKFSQLIFNKI